MKLILTTAVCAVCLTASAQKHQIFAVSAEKIGSFDYSAIQLMDVKSGKTVRQFFNKLSAFEAKTLKTGKRYDASVAFRGADSFMHPMADITGAVAFDARNNRLFIAPVNLNQLRYIDLKKESPSFTYLDDQSFGEPRTNPGAQISRMVIDAKGIGYALSNDGNHLIRFTTGDKVSITDLGAVKDNPSDTLNGYHKNCSCMSYGGDMVADTKGDLYVVTANNRVHKIEIKTLQITFLGTLTGLPEGFTTNGAAVDSDGLVVISSAVSTAAKNFTYYKFDIKTLEAKPLEGTFFNASDLASNNFIQANEERKYVTSADFSFTEVLVENKNVTVYPNPVKGTKIRVTLNDLTPGKYSIALFDLQGKISSERKLNVTSRSHVEEMNAPAAQGQYLLNIVNEKGKIISNTKLMVAAND